MKFQIRYMTEYAYSEPVRDNLNVLRIKPAGTPHQTLEDFSFRVDPETRLHQYRDYFGAEVIEFGVTEPHEHLGIDARMRVTTRAQDVDPEGGWELIAGDAYRAAAGEFLLIGEDAPANGAVAELTETVRGASPLETLLAIADTIPDRFTYDSEATFVGSTVQDLLEGGGGVCQDFVHLGALILRRLGVGARYVSGYLFAAPPDGGQDSVEVQTHAWLEALLPEAAGEWRWIGVDPTNTGRAGETHVKIGHGRDYQDVPPIRGVYQGAATAELTAGVEMRRLNGDAGIAS
jgi:transglutaminase-like putative cysteine protease